MLPSAGLLAPRRLGRKLPFESLGIQAVWPVNIDKQKLPVECYARVCAKVNPFGEGFRV
jgi:hypothetical protein